MRTLLAVPGVVVAAAVAFASPAGAAASPSFGTLAGHYEAIRKTLLHDTLTGIKVHGEAIQRTATAMEARFGSARTAWLAADAESRPALLPRIARVGKALDGARDRNEARRAFEVLTVSMIRYRDTVSGPRPEVVYCPMVRKEWLQPAGEIGNPYLGQRMSTCGQVKER